MTLNKKCLMPFSHCFLETLSPVGFKVTFKLLFFGKPKCLLYAPAQLILLVMSHQADTALNQLTLWS